MGPGTWDLGPGTWDMGPGTWDLGPGNRIENRESRIGEVYLKPITFSRVSQSGQVEIKMGYLYSYTLNPIPTTLYTELDNVAP